MMPSKKIKIASMNAYKPVLIVHNRGKNLWWEEMDWDL
jgi:hypothetical protein